MRIHNVAMMVVSPEGAEEEVLVVQVADLSLKVMQLM